MTRLTQLSVVVMLGIAMPAFSQITFTEADLPKIGDTLHYAVDNRIGALGLGPGGGGNGQVWDFSGLTQRSTYDVRVLAPERSPNGALFPEATIVLELDTFFVYGRQTAEGLYALGTGIDVLNTGTPIPLRLNPAPKVLQFPTTLGTSYEQRYQFVAQLEGSAVGLDVDSVRLIRHAFEQVITNAAGQLTTPAGSYETLRIYSITQSIDSIFVQTFGAWIPVSSDTTIDRNYRWVAKDGVATVLLLFLNDMGQPTRAEWVSGVDRGNETSPPLAQFSYQDQGSGVLAFTDLSTNTPASWNWDFGDGNGGTEQNPAHPYAQSGEYEVCLIVANSAGADTTCQTVAVAKAQPPVAQFRFQDEGKGVIIFTDLSTNAPTSWTWDFGDGSGSDQRNPQHTYGQSGRYSVCLIAVNSAGADTSCQTINVRAPQAPAAQFTFLRQSGNTYAFTDKSTNTPTSWSWEFGDGSGSTQQNPTHSFADGASYTVCLIVANEVGADTTCQTINGSGIQKPVAQFQYIDQGENTYAFTDLSTNEPSSWTWNFGDGKGSSDQNASHIYTASGTYSVCLIAANEAGADTACQVIDVFVPVPPVAQFRFEDRGNATLAFIDLSTNQPLLWSWEFGDGATSTKQNPTHTYEKNGEYKVCLTVANGAGVNTLCQTLEVKKVAPPVAQFRYDKQDEKTLVFTDLSTNGPTSWTWSFGDGDSSGEQNPTHAYQQGGEFTVCLISTNSAGSDTACQRIALTVQQPPAARFSFLKQGNGIYAFTDLSTNNPSSWSWKFGDGNSSTERNPTHTYAQSGAYQVCLIAANAAGFNSSCQTLNADVVLRPVAGFQVTDQGNGAFAFTDQSTNAPTSWTWVFGDGNRGAQQNPSHSYTQSGRYQVCLIAANSAGADTSCQAINAVVAQSPVAAFTYEDRGDLSFVFTDRSTNAPTSWSWGFGDGGGSTERNPAHIYVQGGEFRVCLTSTNSAGDNTYCQTIQVEKAQRPVAAFRFEDRGNRTIAFLDESTNRPASWSWNFGDGNSSTEASPVHTYQNDGAFSVCLTVANSAGFHTECLKVTIGVTSIETLERRYGFRLYPNPVRDLVRIELERLDGDALSLSFYDLSGRPLQTMPLQADQTLDLSAWPEGMYLFVVRSAEGEWMGSGKVQVVR